MSSWFVRVLLVSVAVIGCGDPLEVDDPTAILESEVNTAEGAELLRRSALASLFSAVTHEARDGGLLADEFLADPPSWWSPAGTYPDELIDRRASEEERILAAGAPDNIFAGFGYLHLQEARGHLAPVALEKLRAYARPGAREAHVGEMFAVRGYAEMRLAEDYCPGYPLHDVEDFKQLLGPPTTSTDASFEHALAAFDSALVWGADSARVLHFARIGQARTFLHLGRFAEAAAAVADVPTDYVYRAEYQSPNVENSLASEFGWWGWGIERSVADGEGGNGLDFVSAGDPRVSTVALGTAQDGVTTLYGIGKYPDRVTPVVVASGIEARLIEAEAALNTGGDWLGILNDLRATQISPALPPLADPGSFDAQVDLVFRERAFWLFATGTRLGDLRRLVRIYDRDRESVFPTGAYWIGGSYGPSISLPFPTLEQERGAGRCLGD